ncbi:hypothetical protein JVU11DRAFT_5235 [Chiua virens]|nr:hypothetical protein JVU11DRAFT_5235 [Chiua virens]
MSQHYYQAYMQAYSNNGPSRTTSEGYTLSSTYVPGMAIQTSQATSSLPAALDRAPSQIHSKTIINPILNRLTYGTWYQPGDCRCTRAGCPFTGSRKSVEIHMMDRHFIFPPGWQKRNEWDADPSLRGKPIAIQGTSLVLDAPEAIDAWIAERKRRFPTADRVEDKKRKLEAAAARGELTLEDIGAGSRKKHKRDATYTEGGTRGSRGQGHRRGRGRSRGMVQRRESRPKAVDDVTNPTSDPKTKCTCEASQKSDSSEDDDEAPEVASSKVPTALAYPPKDDVGLNSQVHNLRPSLRALRRKKIPAEETTAKSVRDSANTPS